LQGRCLIRKKKIKKKTNYQKCKPLTLPKEIGIERFAPFSILNAFLIAANVLVWK